MPKFSRNSLDKLQTAHPDLQRLFQEIIKHWDCTVLEGTRSIEQQRENVLKGVSKTMDSKHLGVPARAVDVAPYPVVWDDTLRFYYFAGYVKGVADQLGIKIRFGGDWDGDMEVRDQSFNDLVHFELESI